MEASPRGHRMCLIHLVMSYDTCEMAFIREAPPRSGVQGLGSVIRQPLPSMCQNSRLPEGGGCWVQTILFVQRVSAQCQFWEWRESSSNPSPQKPAKGHRRKQSQVGCVHSSAWSFRSTGVFSSLELWPLSHNRFQVLLGAFHFLRPCVSQATGSEVWCGRPPGQPTRPSSNPTTPCWMWPRGTSFQGDVKVGQEADI